MKRIALKAKVIQAMSQVGVVLSDVHHLLESDLSPENEEKLHSAGALMAASLEDLELVYFTLKREG